MRFDRGLIICGILLVFVLIINLGMDYFEQKKDRSFVAQSQSQNRRNYDGHATQMYGNVVEASKYKENDQDGATSTHQKLYPKTKDGSRLSHPERYDDNKKMGTYNKNHKEEDMVENMDRIRLNYPEVNEAFEGNIFLDFLTLDTSLFSFPSYASMDSLLHIYPNARYKVIYPAFDSVVVYRLGNMISYHQFDKYEKRGYKIDKVLSFVNNRIKGPGRGWWLKNKQLFPNTFFGQREGDKTLSFIQATYFRCLLIWLI